MMKKIMLPFVLLTIHAFAMDFETVKQEILTYIESLDHPARDVSNRFSQNLVIAQKPQDTHMVIYASGIAMVTQKSVAEVGDPGSLKLMYREVPTTIDIGSVAIHFDENVTLFSQKYAYDVLSFDSLLQRYIGKYVLYTEKERDKKRKRAVLVATHPTMVKDLKSGIIFTPQQIFFENIPDDMAVTPSLFWDIETNASLLHLHLEYLAEAISWENGYNLYVSDEKYFDLSAWVTITNGSGISFRDANITIATGSVAAPHDTKQKKDTTTPSEPAGHNYEAMELFQIGHKEDIADKEQKQLLFMHRRHIGYETRLVSRSVHTLAESNATQIRVMQEFSFENDTSNHLGVTLPRGTVRVYRYGSGKKDYFIGSSQLAFSPSGKRVVLNIREFPGILGTEQMTVLKNTPKSREVRYSLQMKNYTEEEQHVYLERALARNVVGHVTVKSSCNGPCTEKRLLDHAILYTVTLPPGESYAFSIDYGFLPEKAPKGAQQ